MIYLSSNLMLDIMNNNFKGIFTVEELSILSNIGKGVERQLN